jgi:hypothetical protein
MIELAERKALPVKKYTQEWIKCPLCLYGNNFVIEIKKSEDDKYFYMEKCPRCNHYDEVREVTKREASKYLILEDLA